MKKKDYLGMFDGLKGILILLIIWGHHEFFVRGTLLPEGMKFPHMFRWSSWILGLFFIMAGYQFRPAKDLKNYAKTQIKTLMVPYAMAIIVSAIILLIYHIMSPDTVRLWDIRMLLLGGVYGTGRNVNILGVWFGGVVALWFLPTFCFSVILYQCLHKIKNVKLRTILIWGITVLTVLFPSDRELVFPFFIVQTCCVLGFIDIGRILKEKQTLYHKLPIFFVGMTILAGLWCQLFSASNIASNIWKYHLIDYFIAIAVDVLILRLYIRTGIGEAKWSGGLSYIGRYSMLIYCIHSVEVQVLFLDNIWKLSVIGDKIPFMAQVISSYILRIFYILVICILLKKIMQFKYRIKIKRRKLNG